MNLLLKAIRNRPLVDQLLVDLDKYSFDHTGKGLALDPENSSSLRDIVYRWINEFEDAENNPSCPKCECRDLMVVLTCPKCGFSDTYPEQQD